MITALTYQGIVNLMRAVAVAVNPDGTFVHARKWDHSLEHNAAIPQIVLYPFNVRGDVYREGDIIIGFWQQDAPNSSNEEREEIISEMDDLMRLFIRTLNENLTIELLNFVAEPNYRQLSGTLSGYLVRFTLRGVLDCENIPLPINVNFDEITS